MTPAATSGGGTSPAAAGREGGALAPAAAAAESACTRGLSEREAAAWTGLLRARERIAQELDRALERDHALSLAEFDVLVHLEAAPDRSLRMAELADAVLLTRSGLTRLVDRLERRGLVERHTCPSDARGFWAVLTGAGAERLDAAAATHADVVRRLLVARLDGGEVEQLAAISGKIAA
jgi:DNA-binding MarR family transcriptional regulator